MIHASPPGSCPMPAGLTGNQPHSAPSPCPPRGTQRVPTHRPSQHALRVSVPLHRARLGFTLIELLIVVGIIALLAAILTPAIGYARRIAREKATLATMASIDQAIAQYRADCNQVPHSRVFKALQHITNASNHPFWRQDNNHRYRGWLGAELLAQALTGTDNELIRRPLSNVAENRLFDLPADLAAGPGMRITADALLKPGTSDPQLDDDGSIKLRGKLLGPYFDPAKLVPISRLDSFQESRSRSEVTGPPNVIVDAFGGPIVYYRAQPVSYPGNLQQTLFEPASAPAGATHRDTGFKDATPDRAITIRQGGKQYGGVPRFDLDHNWLYLRGRKPAYASSETEPVRRFLKNWSDSGSYLEDTADDGFDRVDQRVLNSKEYLLISPGADGVFGRFKENNAGSCDDLGNFSSP